MADHDDHLPRLLEQLCVKLGFCLDPVEWQRIVDDPPTTAEAFTDEVIVGEGRTRPPSTAVCADKFAIWSESHYGLRRSGPLRVLAVEEGQCVHDRPTVGRYMPIS